MKLFMLVFMAFFSVTVYALDGPPPEVFSLIEWIAGEKFALVMTIFMTVGYFWALIRQFIPADKLAKLPDWLVTVLEFFAANKGHAKNRLDNDPIHTKLYKSSP